MTDTPDETAEFHAAPAELCPGLMAAAEWHESRLPFWDELIEKYRAIGNLGAERSACAYRNSHISSASILRGKAAGEIGL